MAEKTDRNEFSWVEQDERMPFPLDYPLDDLDRLWGQNRGRITKYITKYSPFQDFYVWMRYTKKKSVKEKEYTKRGVPAELEPFFHAYFTEICAFRGRTDEKKIPEFEKIFCKQLHEKALKLESEYSFQRSTDHDNCSKSALLNEERKETKPNDLYWYRRLYENMAFQKIVSSAYWEQEYNYRADSIRELSLQLPVEMEVAQLHKVITSMDTQIASMLHIIDSEEKKNIKKQGNSFLGTFPQELIEKLRHRVARSKESDKRASYCVHDIKIATEVCGEPVEKTLEKFFEDIRSNNNTKATREAVRPFYLQDVCKVPEQSKFQKVCLELQKYIDTYVDCKKSKEEIESYIIYRCKVYYEPFFSLWATPIGTLQPGYNCSVGAELVIDELISALYSDFYSRYMHEISFICNANRDIEKHCGNVQKWIEEQEKAGRSRDDVIRSCAQRHFNIIKSLCNSNVVEKPAILDEKLTQADIMKLSQTVVEQCKNACYEFNRSECEWMNEETLRNLWTRHNEICYGTDISILPAGTCKEDILLYTALFICRVRDDCHRTKMMTLKVYTMLIEHLQNKKVGVQRAPQRK